jgi:peptide-methionine (S)-S-oxide reductase
VVRTRVGYSGGATPNPTYHHLGDHSETVQIDFDPRKVSYRELLAVFWQGHAPGVKPWSRQYRAVIFFHNPEQQRLARQSREQVAARLQGPVYTEILPASHFYPAEDYHQKYFLRQKDELFNAFKAVYPREADLISSTAAARVNGYVAGYGVPAALRRDLPLLGLSPAGGQRLLELVAGREGQPTGPGCPVVR